MLDLQQSSTLLPTPSQEYFQQWVEMALEQKHADAELCIRIIDIDEMSTFNLKYRNKNGPTNVLSFPAQIPPELQLNILGDILICAPLVEEEAACQQKEILHHWAHLTVHGVLHLVGYDHKTHEEAEIMEGMEREIMKKLGYPDPYLVENSR